MAKVENDSKIDVVNSADEIIGRTLRRDALSAIGFRTAHLLLFNSVGDILLQQLTRTRERHPGCWGSSVAAYLHSGESYKDAVKRRANEELSIDIEGLRYLGRTVMQDGDALKHIAVFSAPTAGLPYIRELDHIAEVRYWSQQEIELSLGDTEVFTPSFTHIYRWLRDSDRPYRW